MNKSPDFRLPAAKTETPERGAVPSRRRHDEQEGSLFNDMDSSNLI